MSLRTVTVVAARMLTHNVRELTIDPGPDFSYVAGQWVSLRIALSNGEFVSRAYSIASAPRTDRRFELAITRVEGGPGSMRLHEMAVGDALEMTHPQGFFTLEPVARPILFVATGTGLTPLRAMLQAAIEHRDRASIEHAPITLLHGVRSEEDLLYEAELRALAADGSAGFRFEPTLSRASDRWSARRGYVQTHVAELIESFGSAKRDATDVDVYICGLNRMVKEVRAVLKATLGFTRERIHSERYD